MTYVKKDHRGGSYDWTDVYICIYTHIYKADLHGQGTAVVNQGVWKQSGHVFVRIFFFFLLV